MCVAGECNPSQTGSDAQTGCYCQSALETVNVIIGVSLDESGSINVNDYITAKGAVADFIEVFDAANPTASFYVNKFDDTVETVAALSNDGVAVATAVRNAGQQGGFTAIGDAIANLGANMQGPCATANTFCLGIVITDGRSNEGADPIMTSTNFKDNVGQLAVLGVGPNTNANANAQYASPNLSFPTADFSQLDATLAQLLEEICPLDGM